MKHKQVSRWTDLRKIKRPNGYDLYEVMSSRLTNVHTHGLLQNAKGSEWIMGYNKECSFGLLDFDTTQEDPQVKYRIIKGGDLQLFDLSKDLKETTNIATENPQITASMRQAIERFKQTVVPGS